MVAEHALALNAEAEPVGEILVVVNPLAGGVRRHPGLVRRLEHAVGGRGAVVTTPDLAALVKAVAEARARGVDTIGICGGDGSNLHALTAIANAWRGAEWPRLVLLAGGSVNTAARNLGAAGEPVERLAALLMRRTPRALRMPLVRANGRVGFMFGSQIVARVLDAYDAGPSGPSGCVLLAAKILQSAARGGALARHLLEPEAVEITIDGVSRGTIDVRGLMACVVTSPAVGLRATRRGGEGGGFHIVATNAGPTQLFRDLPRLWTGLPFDSLCVDEVAHEATLSFAGSGRYTLDGDLFAAKTVRLTATEPVTILYP